jgi:hypothetical protein
MATPPRRNQSSAQATSSDFENTYNLKMCWGMSVPQPSTLVATVKLASLFSFAGAASFFLLGIEVSDNNLYMEIQDNELYFTTLFLCSSLLLVAQASYNLHAVNNIQSPK